MDAKEFFELASYVVTVIGLPVAIGIFFYEQRKERENEEEEQYQHLSDAYNDFLKIVLDNALGKHPLPEWLAWVHDLGIDRNTMGLALFAGVATIVIAAIDGSRAFLAYGSGGRVKAMWGGLSWQKGTIDD